MALLRRRIPFLYFRSVHSIVVDKMEKCNVVPDVIDDAPDEKAEVVFTINAKADLGNKLKPTEVKNIPKVTWKAEEDTFYTLCVVDPDAPSRSKPVLREWKHWLVGNIPGTSVSKGDELAQYVGAGPPRGTGFHRYIYLIYRQRDKIKFYEKHLTNRSTEHREGFCIRKFAEKYKLGCPVAANFYIAEWDEYVPILYKQLGAV